MKDDDEVDALERRLVRQSRRMRFAGGVAASLMGLVGVVGAFYALKGGNPEGVVGGVTFTAFALAGARRLFQGRSTEGLQMHNEDERWWFTDDDDKKRD